MEYFNKSRYLDGIIKYSEKARFINDYKSLIIKNYKNGLLHGDYFKYKDNELKEKCTLYK